MPLRFGNPLLSINGGMWTIDGDNGQVWQPYGRANLWRDWGAEATTMFGIDPVPLIEEATRLEFAGGVTAKLGAGQPLCPSRLSVRSR